MIQQWIEQMWYARHPLRQVLQPFSWLFQRVVILRRWFLECFLQTSCPVPLIVVGNITVGGVGKTPLVIALVQQLQKKGLKVGVVSRGYGAKSKVFPREVTHQDKAYDVGDEPLLLAKKTNCPVVIAPDRMEAVRYLLDKHACQVIISDDGLQHYRMGRSIEIAVLDGTRGLGNGLCLPAGPLREPLSRLKEVDFVIANEGLWEHAYSMRLQPEQIKALSTDQDIDHSLLSGPWEAVAAIGNPQRFYSTLSQLGIEFNSCSYPDHYQFQKKDFDGFKSLVIMTEKDAVKCRSFSSKNMYYLPVHAVLEDAFWDAFWSNQHLKRYC